MISDEPTSTSLAEASPLSPTLVAPVPVLTDVRTGTSPGIPLGTAPGTGAGPSAPSTLPGPSLRKLTVMGVLAGAVVVAGAVAGGSSFISQVPGAWFFGTPGGPLGSVARHGSHPPLAAMVAVYGGLIVLCRIWFQALRVLRHHRGMPVRRVVGMITAWAVPFALAPPLFSRDVYSYAGQGEMVSHHINPYLYGTGVLGSTPFSVLPGPFWGNTPSPYGPTFLWIDGLLTRLSGHHALVDLALLRTLAVTGVVLLVLGLASLARTTGRDPAAVVLLGAGSPLVLSVLIGGSHNDALMVGLLACGLAVGLRFNPVPGIVLCALAAGVKAPAALGVLFLAWTWPGRQASLKRRVGYTAMATAIAVTTLAAVSAASGIGWGWVHTATAPDHVVTSVTPVDALAGALASISHLIGMNLGNGTIRGIVSVLALLVAAGVGAHQLWHSPEHGPVRPLGVTLLVLAILGPILWPWYVTWGIALLAVVATGRLRWVLIALVTAQTLIGVMPVNNAVGAIGHAGVLSALLVVLSLIALTIAPLALHHRTRQVPGTLDQLPTGPVLRGEARRKVRVVA